MRAEATKFLVSSTEFLVGTTKFGKLNQKFRTADQKFDCLGPHHFLIGIQPKFYIDSTKLLFGCPNPHKRLEAPTKFLYMSLDLLYIAIKISI